jgi:REP element-mobilizing transposase RayT
MARPLRIAYPGALYHLIARGNNRQRCFLGEDDFLLFLETLEQLLGRFSWLLYAYCLMDNHYHLEVETPLPNLKSGTRQLNGPEVALALAPLLRLFSDDPVHARASYREYVQEGIAEALVERVRGERLGSDAFLRERFGQSRRCRRSRASRSSRSRPAWPSSSPKRFYRSRRPTAGTATRSARSPPISAATTRPSAGACAARKTGWRNARLDPEPSPPRRHRLSPSNRDTSLRVSYEL